MVSLLELFHSLIYEIKPYVTHVSSDTMMILINSRKAPGKREYIQHLEHYTIEDGPEFESTFLRTIVVETPLKTWFPDY